MDELTGLDLIAADTKLTAEAKALATDAAALDTLEAIAELKDVDGVVTFAALCARMKEANPDAKDSDIEQAVAAWWIY
jgi:2-keto-3-deoxy-L-rhamnonate aldolase RhmA